MNDYKKILKRIALYYLILAAGVIPTSGLIPDIFPTRHISSLFFAAMSLCLVMYYRRRLVGYGRLKEIIMSVSYMILILFLLRGLKYSVFSQFDTVSRLCWYLYYLPQLSIPALLLIAVLVINSENPDALPGIAIPVIVITAALVLLVLSNDLHQLVFSFNPGFYNWDRDYSHGFVFYAIYIWEYYLYFVSVSILIIKCRVSSAIKNSWIILIPFITGIAMILLINFGRMPRPFGNNIIEFPEASAFMVAGVFECCMLLGLIPTNENYRALMAMSPLSACITDTSGNIVYKSDNCLQTVMRPGELDDRSYIDANTVLRKMSIPGGYGFWFEDVTMLAAIKASLEETRERLSEEADLNRLKNELKEQQAELIHRIHIYDEISGGTEKQSERISEIASRSLESSDSKLRDFNRKYICFLASYIKRYANLMLVSSDRGSIPAAELALAFSESLHYLNYLGIRCGIMNSADCRVPRSAALCIFEAFEAIAESCINSVKGIYVNIAESENTIVFKLNFESVVIEPGRPDAFKLQDSGLSCGCDIEDGNSYLCFRAEKGGAK